MRTQIVLGAMLGCMAFGAETQTQKTTPTLSTAERLAIAGIMARSKALADEQTQLGQQFEAIKRESCQLHYKQDACQVNESGQIIPTPPATPAKPEVKK